MTGIMPAAPPVTFTAPGIGHLTGPWRGLAILLMPLMNDPPGRGVAGRAEGIGAGWMGLAPIAALQFQYGTTSHTFTTRKLPHRS